MVSSQERPAAYIAALEDVDAAGRALSEWDAHLIRPQVPARLMNALDQALAEVARIRESEADRG